MNLAKSVLPNLSLILYQICHFHCTHLFSSCVRISTSAENKSVTFAKLAYFLLINELWQKFYEVSPLCAFLDRSDISMPCTPSLPSPTLHTNRMMLPYPYSHLKGPVEKGASNFFLTDLCFSWFKRVKISQIIEFRYAHKIGVEATFTRGVKI